MATKKLGKLSYDFSSEGFAFRWGDDGKIHHLDFSKLPLIGRKSGEADDDAYEEDEYGDAPDYSYDARGYSDGYDDEEDYGDRGGYGAYEGDRGYSDDDRYEDDYDDGYGSYESDDDEYYEPGYDDEEEAPSRLAGVWDLIDRYPWIIYALLVLLPPLGIWLLWKQKHFDFSVRTAVSAVSGIWFLVLLIWLITSLTGGSSVDPTIPANNSITFGSAAPSATVSSSTLDVASGVTDSTEGEDTETGSTFGNDGAGTDGTDAEGDLTADGLEPESTALATETGTGETATDSTDTVYSPTIGAYYHSTPTCSAIGTAVVTPVTLDVAQSRGQSPCPTCMNGAGTALNPSATPLTGSATVAPGTTANPAKATSSKDKSGITVYAKEGGKYYHKRSSCSKSGFSGGKAYTLYNAIQADFSACPYCLSSGNDKVYYTEKGTYYHSYSTCTGMSGAKKRTLAEAIAIGKKKCPNCWGSSAGNASSSSDSDSKTTVKQSSGPNVYVFENNKYYHTKSGCSGLTGAKKVSLKDAMNAGRKACPTCASSASKTVYASSGGKYYHYSSSCEKLNGRAKKGTLAEALTYSLSACPVCVKGQGSAKATATSTPKPTVAPVKDKSGISVYATKSGKYYHRSVSCSSLGSDEYYKVSLGTAVAADKSPCPNCCSGASHKVYSGTSDKYYHYSKRCTRIGSNPKSGTLAKALMAGLKACPVCTKDSDSQQSAKATATPKPTSKVVSISSSTSGTKVYVSTGSKYYHTQKSCGNISGMTGVSLETAKNYGLKACPNCADIADVKVYAVSGGRYYHRDKNCGGMSGAKSGTLEKAKLAGLKACPICVTGTVKATAKPTASPTKKPSESGESSGGSADGTTRVYIDLSSGSNVYHKSSKCSHIDDATSVTLNYVIDMGFDACPYCDPPTVAVNAG